MDRNAIKNCKRLCRKFLARRIDDKCSVWRPKCHPQAPHRREVSVPEWRNDDKAFDRVATNKSRKLLSHALSFTLDDERVTAAVAGVYDLAKGLGLVGQAASSSA